MAPISKTEEPHAMALAKCWAPPVEAVRRVAREERQPGRRYELHEAD
jgi:hypothetical protein